MQSIRLVIRRVVTRNGEMLVIDDFCGKYAFLSNFFVSRYNIGTFSFLSAEHAYQAYKASSMRDFDLIRLAKTPRAAKRTSRLVQVRSDWNEIKVAVMQRALQHKFVNNDDLRHRLLDTGDCVLIEKNRWGDKFWGVSQGKGSNVLGILLMRLRTELELKDID